MPLEAPFPAATARSEGLNRELAGHGAIAVMTRALRDPAIGPAALVSAFGAESVVLLHMLSRIDRSVPVIFLDTGLLFAATLDYQRAVAERLRLSDVRVVRPGDLAEDPAHTLHRVDPDACCALRKARPLARALAPFDAWINGRKRFQGGTRAALEFFEPDPVQPRRLKVNPLARWAPADVRDYMVENRLPRHPLVAQGYGSIGCAPCTVPGTDRDGRWAGQDKAECGIHFVDGRMVRGPATAVP